MRDIDDNVQMNGALNTCGVMTGAFAFLIPLHGQWWSGGCSFGNIPTVKQY